MQWNDEPLAGSWSIAWPSSSSPSGSQWFSVVRRPGFLGSCRHSDWLMARACERGGLRGSFWGGAFGGAVLGKLRFAFGTYPRPSRVSGCVEFASPAITAAPSRYLSLRTVEPFEAATLAIQFSASACDLVSTIRNLAPVRMG